MNRFGELPASVHLVGIAPRNVERVTSPTPSSFTRRAFATMLVAAGAVVLDACTGSGSAAASGSARSSGSPVTTAATSSAASGFNTKKYSTTDPASIWVVVNKKHPLRPKDWAPTDLVHPAVANVNGQPVRKAAGSALVAMFAAAKAEKGLTLSLQSGYRSYQTQVRAYAAAVAANGRAKADRVSAHPGYSEHQTGLAVDISAVPAAHSLQTAFGTTAHGRWLAANAHRFGFLLRYPADKVRVTGYDYEPWHFRYIGTELAQYLWRHKVKTLEEFFGVSGGTNY